MEENRITSANPKKGVSIAILVLAVFALVFGAIRIRQQIYAERTALLASIREDEANAAPSGLTEALAAQGKDTDEDGLNDYDELNRYKTSPYLKDTDSDGIDDGTEIAAKSDPNCPKDALCANPPPQTPAPAVLTPPVIPGIVPSLLIPSPAPGIGSLVTLPPFTPEGTRAILRESGLSEAQIAALDDATLKKLYEDAAEQAQRQSSPSEADRVGTGQAQRQSSPSEADRVGTGQAPITNPPSGRVVTGQAPSVLDQPAASAPKVTAQELRQLLKAGGVSDELLKTVDDETLMKMAEESMSGGQ